MELVNGTSFGKVFADVIKRDLEMRSFSWISGQDFQAITSVLVPERQRESRHAGETAMGRLRQSLE